MKITIGKNMENWLFIKKNRSASDFVLLLNTAPAPPVRMGRSDNSRRRTNIGLIAKFESTVEGEMCSSPSNLGVYSK